jgi:hypothetical protein
MSKSSRWPDEHILEAVQRQLDEHPNGEKRSNMLLETSTHGWEPPTFSDEDAATGCLRDGTSRIGLESHAQHDWRPAANSGDEGIR